MRHGTQMRCPLCGSEYVHLIDTQKVSGNDGYQAGWWGRGDLNILRFEGECGHEFELCFGSHKGNVYTFHRILIYGR